jgi:hypothetical protein
MGAGLPKVLDSKFAYTVTRAPIQAGCRDAVQGGSLAARD